MCDVQDGAQQVLDDRLLRTQCMPCQSAHLHIARSCSCCQACGCSHANGRKASACDAASASMLCCSRYPLSYQLANLMHGWVMHALSIVHASTSAQSKLQARQTEVAAHICHAMHLQWTISPLLTTRIPTDTKEAMHRQLTHVIDAVCSQHVVKGGLQRRHLLRLGPVQLSHTDLAQAGGPAGAVACRPGQQSWQVSQGGSRAWPSAADMSQAACTPGGGAAGMVCP